MNIYDQFHAEKYRAKGETHREAMNRIASALQDDDEHFRHSKEILRCRRFLPAGRVQAAAGSPRQVTAINCFVSGTVPDSFVTRDNKWRSSIMHRAEQAAATMRMGGGIGYDFSTLRPRNDLIKTLLSGSSGPLGFMPVYDAIGQATSSAGNRRGAQMAVLRVDHPDVLEFVRAKQNDDSLTGFNVSVAVTDEFMDALARERTYELRFDGRRYGEADAVDVWEAIMRSTWDWAEPGVVFIDTINRMNNLWYCEKIAATNPCGEQPLPPFGACLLGSVNLPAYLSEDGSSFDYEQLAEDVPHILAMMDNVIEETHYPLPEQKYEHQQKRRIGIGVTGYANAVETLGMPYGSSESSAWLDRTLSALTTMLYRSSALRAREKGPFPLYREEDYLRGEFVRRLDEDTRDMIAKYGIRNSHLTSIAPTGTISLCAGNVSSSIEPVYRWKQQRQVRMEVGPVVAEIHDWAFEHRRVRGRRAAFGEVTVDQHVDVLTIAQQHIDSAVSKTINTDGSVPWDDFKNVYLRAYVEGAKGCTTFNRDGRRAGIFKQEDEPADLPFPGDQEEEGGACYVDPLTGTRSCD